MREGSDLILPIVMLIIAMVVSMLYTGGLALKKTAKSLPF